MNLLVFGIVSVLCIGYSFGAPSLVLSTTSVETQKLNGIKDNTDTAKQSELVIYEFGVTSNISNRYAKTLITSKVKNPNAKAKEATFSVILPEKAFISEFVMEIKGESYKAYVKEKEEAKKIYEKAVESGQSAGHVATNARDSNRFTISVNIEPETKAVFLLTYEELLERKNNQYELILNVRPGQIVKDLHIQVLVNESRPLKFVRTPALRSGNEITKNDDSLKPSSDIHIINETSATIYFKPDIEQQKKFVEELGGKEVEGLSGQFVVQYDVDRSQNGQEILLRDGYFVHFFAPENIKPLAEHVVFILDTSGSMFGTKLKQLKDAMSSILSQLREDDMFHIIEFNSFIYVWNVDDGQKIKVNITNDDVPFEDVQKAILPEAVLATKANVAKGKAAIEKIEDEGITNMLSALITGLHLAKSTLKKQAKNMKSHQPIIIFLTDGDPTAGIIDTNLITNITTEYNSKEPKIPIFALSFGDEADKSFLRKLSLRNVGFSRHIYEAADASLQLQNFYKEISSPLLSNVHFKYDSDVKEVSKKDFPIFFRGSELVTVGKYEGSLVSTVEGFGIDGSLEVPSVTAPSVTPIERLWAYLTIKQKLEERETVENKTQLTKEALDLALRYSFVTDVSSLVVVKPNDSSTVDTVDASKTVNEEFEGIQAISLRFDDDLDGSFSNAFLTNDLQDEHDKFYDSNWPVFSKEPIPPPTLEEILPWLEYVLNPNKTITISGRAYELGEHAKNVTSVACPKTPFKDNEHGECVLLKDCPLAFMFLDTFQDYEKYFCPLENNKYAGVCC